MLLGREAEFAGCLQALHDANALLVTGEAGIGKTTLLRAAAERTGRTVREGGALATLSWVDYLPLARALGRDPAGGDAEAVAFDVARAVGDGILLLDDLQWAAAPTVTVVNLLAGRVPLAVGIRTETADQHALAASLEELGFVRIALGPLAGEAAAELARRSGRGLTPCDAAAIVGRAGGNPLLLRELAASGGDSPDLRQAVEARLRRLPGADRDAFCLLALAGRPLPRSVLGAAADSVAVDSLASSGLVDIDGATIAARHLLLADAAVAGMTDERRREMHLRLATTLPDPGESARHYYAAGDHRRCREAALRAASAATRPGERASHLRLAALSATGADADELRLAAAESLEAAHDWPGLFEVLDQISDTRAETTAPAALLRARAAWSGGRTAELEPVIATGLAAATPGSDVNVLLHIEACRGPIFVTGDFEAGLEQAREAYGLALHTGVGIGRAEYFLGTVLFALDRPGAREHLEHAMEAARRTGDVSTELTAGHNLLSYHESAGSPDVGADLARHLIARAAELGLGYWGVAFRHHALQLRYHAAGYEGLADDIADLLRHPCDARTWDALEELLCMTLVDTGRADEAILRAEQAMDAATPDSGGRPHFWWALAEAALWSADPKRALAHADRFLAELPESNPNRALGVLTRAWARLEFGLDPTDSVEVTRQLLLAVPHELRALSLAYAGDLPAAESEFRAAAARWAAYHVRGELRCEWASGEMLRRAGMIDDAVRTLTAVEKRCADVGLVAILNRARRSLRASGERRMARRSSTAAGLTAREREVLDLVARGLTNDQIASRLGVTRRTVVAQVATASTKLGAENRLQAAAIAASLSDD